MRIDYIVAKAERGYTKGEKAAIGGGVAAGLGGMVGEHVNVERHNYALNRGRQAAGGWTPEAKRVMRSAKRNVWASRGIYGAGTLAALGGVAHRANRLNRSES